MFSRGIKWLLWKGYLTPKEVTAHRLRITALVPGRSDFWPVFSDLKLHAGLSKTESTPWCKTSNLSLVPQNHTPDIQKFPAQRVHPRLNSSAFFPGLPFHGLTSLLIHMSLSPKDGFQEAVDRVGYLYEHSPLHTEMASEVGREVGPHQKAAFPHITAFWTEPWGLNVNTKFEQVFLDYYEVCMCKCRKIKNMFYLILITLNYLYFF